MVGRQVLAQKYMAMVPLGQQQAVMVVAAVVFFLRRPVRKERVYPIFLAGLVPAVALETEALPAAAAARPVAESMAFMAAAAAADRMAL